MHLVKDIEAFSKFINKYLSMKSPKLNPFTQSHAPFVKYYLT